eukprot:9188108-Lingulodinium_polyedra.AAC.1
MRVRASGPAAPSAGDAEPSPDGGAKARRRPTRLGLSRVAPQGLRVRAAPSSSDTEPAPDGGAEARRRPARLSLSPRCAPGPRSAQRQCIRHGARARRRRSPKEPRAPRPPLLLC